MPKNCISIYNEFSNIGPTRRTWTWRIKVKGPTFQVKFLQVHVAKCKALINSHHADKDNLPTCSYLRL